MTSILRKLRAGIMTAGVVGALGFGAMQALSAQLPDPTPLPIPCESQACDLACMALFGPFASGYCGPEGECRCAV